MNCTDAREGMSAMLDDAISKEGREGVAAHLLKCPGCVAYWSDLAQVRALLHSVCDADEPTGNSASVGKGVLEAIRSPRGFPGRRRVFVLFQALFMVSIIGAFFWIRSHGRNELPPNPPVSTRKPPEPGLPAEKPPDVKGPTIAGHVELVAADEATCDDFHKLFRTWPGAFSVTAGTDNELALKVDYEGADNPRARSFLDALDEFQRSHARTIRSWSARQEHR